MFAYDSVGGSVTAVQAHRLWDAIAERDTSRFWRDVTRRAAGSFGEGEIH